MQRNDFRARALALALAAVIVAGAMLAFATTGNANFRDALAAAEQRHDVQPVRVVIEPARIDVVGARTGTRTARVDERGRPQS